MMKTNRNSCASPIDLDLSENKEAPPAALLGQAGTKIDVDLAMPGKQHGHLKIPAMGPSHSLQQLNMPVCVIRGANPGPVVTFLAGIHGDEYEGTLTLRKLAQEISDNQLHGCLIVLPAINTRGLRDGVRANPVDRLDIDYAFPGTINGTSSERLAHAITQHFLKQSDLVVDLRSGGRHLQFIPSAAVRFCSNDHRQGSSENAMIAFGAPNSLRLPPSAPDSCLQGMLDRMNKDYVQVELGGGAGCSLHSLAIAFQGCMNVLRHKGMLKDELELASTRLLEVRDDSYYIYAECDGMFEPITYLGEPVWQDEPLARIVALHDTAASNRNVPAPRNAVLIAAHHGGMVRQGDLIAILAMEVRA